METETETEEKKENSVEKKSSQKQQKRKKTMARYTEFALLFVLGLLVGFSIKIEAVKRFSMGGNDYMVSQRDREAIRINDIQKRFAEQGISGPALNTRASQGISCGQ